MTQTSSLQSVYIGVDIDNVISDTDSVLRKLIKKEYGITAARDDIRSWNYSDSIEISKTQEKNILELFHNEYCLYAKPISGAEKALDTLAKSHKIILITSRPKETEALTRKWLYRNKITFYRLIHSRKKYRYSNLLLTMIEDNWETANLFANRGVNAILFKRPWNERFPAHPKIACITNWEEIYPIISSLSISSINLPHSIWA